jgi:hypothetical protein
MDGCRDYRLGLAFGSRWTCDGKNSLEFERVIAVMHESSPWMFGRKGALRRPHRSLVGAVE